jgi:hypothetical protein
MRSPCCLSWRSRTLSTSVPIFSTFRLKLRPRTPIVDPKVYEQIRSLLQGSIAVPGGLVDGQLIEDTAKNISLILRGLSESYHAQYAITASDGLTLWDASCYPHPSTWRLREVVGTLLA